MTKDETINGANLTLEELESLAEEIRLVLIRGRGLTISQYIQRASTVSPLELGYRKIRAICNEPKLEAYFPDEVFKVLVDRFSNNTKRIACVNDDDIKFLVSHTNKGAKWLARYMYTTPDAVRDIAKRNGIGITKPYNDYTPEKIEFIRQNAGKGTAWLSKSLGFSKKSVSHKAIRLGISLGHFFPSKPFTQEEDELLMNNASNGTLWLSSRLGRSINSVRRRAKKLGITIDRICHGKKTHKFIEKDDQFIRRNSDMGALWLSRKMKLPIDSIRARARKKKIQIRTIQRVYTAEDNQFIKNNIEKGIKYLARYFKASCDAIRRKIKRLGINTDETHRDNGRELQPSDAGTLTVS